MMFALRTVPMAIVTKATCRHRPRSQLGSQEISISCSNDLIHIIRHKIDRNWAIRQCQGTCWWPGISDWQLRLFRIYVNLIITINLTVWDILLMAASQANVVPYKDCGIVIPLVHYTNKLSCLGGVLLFVLWVWPLDPCHIVAFLMHLPIIFNWQSAWKSVYIVQCTANDLRVRRH